MLFIHRQRHRKLAATVTACVGSSCWSGHHPAHHPSSANTCAGPSTSETAPGEQQAARCGVVKLLRGYSGGGTACSSRGAAFHSSQMLLRGGKSPPPPPPPRPPTSSSAVRGGSKAAPSAGGMLVPPPPPRTAASGTVCFQGTPRGDNPNSRVAVSSSSAQKFNAGDFDTWRRLCVYLSEGNEQRATFGEICKAFSCKEQRLLTIISTLGPKEFSLTSPESGAAVDLSGDNASFRSEELKRMHVAFGSAFLEAQKISAEFRERRSAAMAALLRNTTNQLHALQTPVHLPQAIAERVRQVVLRTRGQFGVALNLVYPVSGLGVLPSSMSKNSLEKMEKKCNQIGIFFDRLGFSQEQLQQLNLEWRTGELVELWLTPSGGSTSTPSVVSSAPPTTSSNRNEQKNKAANIKSGAAQSSPRAPPRGSALDSSSVQKPPPPPPPPPPLPVPTAGGAKGDKGRLSSPSPPPPPPPPQLASKKQESAPGSSSGCCDGVDTESTADLSSSASRTQEATQPSSVATPPSLPIGVSGDSAVRRFAPPSRSQSTLRFADVVTKCCESFYSASATDNDESARDAPLIGGAELARKTKTREAIVETGKDKKEHFEAPLFYGFKDQRGDAGGGTVSCSSGGSSTSAPVLAAHKHPLDLLHGILGVVFRNILPKLFAAGTDMMHISQRISWYRFEPRYGSLPSVAEFFDGVFFLAERRDFDELVSAFLPMHFMVPPVVLFTKIVRPFLSESQPLLLSHIGVAMQWKERFAGRYGNLFNFLKAHHCQVLRLSTRNDHCVLLGSAPAALHVLPYVALREKTVFDMLMMDSPSTPPTSADLDEQKPATDVGNDLKNIIVPAADAQEADEFVMTHVLPLLNGPSFPTALSDIRRRVLYRLEGSLQLARLSFAAIMCSAFASRSSSSKSPFQMQWDEAVGEVVAFRADGKFCLQLGVWGLSLCANGTEKVKSRSSMATPVPMDRLPQLLDVLLGQLPLLDGIPHAKHRSLVRLESLVSCANQLLLHVEEGEQKASLIREALLTKPMSIVSTCFHDDVVLVLGHEEF